MSTELATTQTRGIAQYTPEVVELLDQHSETGVSRIEANARLSHLATISAGYKEGNRPMVERGGKIHLHEDMGDAPGIRSALEATGYRSLTIVLLYDDIAQNLRQMFTNYGSVKMFGDKHSITCLKAGKTPTDPPSKIVYQAGTEDYKKCIAQCKVSTFVPFALGQWQDGQPMVIWPDGLLPYRLRFGSKSSAINFIEAIRAIKQLTGGVVKGVPLELTLGKRSVLTPQMERREMPVWRVCLKHPSDMPMTAHAVRNILEQGTANYGSMALPAPDVDPEIIFAHDEIFEVDPALDDEATATLTTGISADLIKSQYFSLTKGTPYADEKRAEMVRDAGNKIWHAYPSDSLKLLATDIMDGDDPVGAWQRAAEYIAQRVADEYPVAQTPTQEPRISHKRGSMADNGEPDPFADKPLVEQLQMSIDAVTAQKEAK